MVETAQADLMAQWVGLLRLANQTLLDTGYRPDELADYSPLAEELAHHPREPLVYLPTVLANATGYLDKPA